MSRHILSCFNIENANELRAAYRLVDVEGPFDAGRSDGDLAERNLQNLVRLIQFEEQIRPRFIGRGRTLRRPSLRLTSSGRWSTI